MLPKCDYFPLLWPGGANCRPMIHPVVGVSGSAPALCLYVYRSDGRCRRPRRSRAQAYKFAAQAVMAPPKWCWRAENTQGAEDMVCSLAGPPSKPCACWKRKVPLGGNRSHHPVYGKIRETEPLLKLSRRASSPERLKNKGARALPFFQAFFRQLLMKVLRSSPFSDFAVAALLQSLIFCC